MVWAAAHVGHWDRLTGLLDEVEETLGPVEVLVDNAGTAPLFPSLEQVSEQLRDKVIDQPQGPVPADGYGRHVDDRPGGRVMLNTVLAGPFFTDISDAWDMQAFDTAAASWPSRRGGDPGEIVGAALYLCGPASSFTTGALLAVDGGRLAAP